MKEREASFKKRKLIVEKPPIGIAYYPEEKMMPTGAPSVQTKRRLLFRKKSTTSECCNNSSVEENMRGQGTAVQETKRKRLSSGFVEIDSPLQKKGSSFHFKIAIERKRVKRTSRDSFPTVGGTSETQNLSDMVSKHSDSGSTPKNVVKKQEKVFPEKGEMVEERQKKIRLEGQNGDERPDGKKTKDDKGNVPKESFGIGKRRAFFLTQQNDEEDEIAKKKKEGGEFGQLPKVSSSDGQIKSKKRPIAEFADIARISTGKRVHFTTFMKTLSKKRKPEEEYCSRTLLAEKDTGSMAISEGESSTKRLRQTLSKKRTRSEENSTSSEEEDGVEGRTEPLKKKVTLETEEIKKEKDLEDHWKEAMGGNETEDSTLDYWREKVEYLQKVDEFLKSLAVVEEVQASSFRKWMLRDPCDAPLYPNPSQVEEENLFSSWLVEVRKDSEEPMEPEKTFSHPTGPV